ncbi:tape measure protein [Pseudomonas aeruginosa]|uniref:tape measure protein n=1 Tax=Pseudomonas aeruginosa TaxID=287 RepID=UPI0021191FFE|nr:tape measure protein [Pseudomonas aeruginosa]
MANPMQRLIQFVLRGRDELSPAAQQSTEALEGLRTTAANLNRQLDDAKGARGLVTALGTTERAIAQTQTSVQRVDRTIADLREALDRNPGSRGLAVSLQIAERDAAGLRRTLDQLTARHAEQQRAARAAGVDTGQLANEERRLASVVDNTRESIAQNSREIRELERAQMRAAREAAGHTSRVTALREAMSSGVRQAAAYAAAFVGIQAALNLVRRGIGLVRDGIVSMLTTGDQFENLQNRLTSLMGSVAEGERATAWIKTFAKDTPLQLGDVTDAFALLKAYGLDPMDGSLKAIEDQSEKLGGGMERLEGITTAVGQAWAKQKLQTEEILQLVERGVPVWDMLAKVTGKNAAQLQDLASKGKLGRDVIKALVDEMGRSSEGAAAKAMSTLTGLVSNLGDTAADFLNRIANAGALDHVKNKLKELGDTIAQMDQDGRLDALAKGLSDAFVQGSEWVERFIKRLADVDFGTLIDKTSAWLGSFSTQLDDMASRVQLFIAPFRTLFNGVTSGISAIALAWTGTLSLMVAGIEKVAEKIPAALGGERIRSSVAGIHDLLSSMSEGFRQQIQQDAQDIADAWDTSTTATASAAQQQSQAITDTFTDLKAGAKSAAAESVQAVTSLQNALDQISAAKTTEQLTALQGEMLKAYQAGTLSQQEYANGAGVLNAKLTELKSTASGAALGVSDLSTGLENLKQVQDAISSAKTTVDIQNIRTALGRLYNDGTISAREFNQEQTKLSAKIKELKAPARRAPRVCRRSRSPRTRRPNRFGPAQGHGESMEATRKGVASTKDDMGAFEGFFGGVLSTARQGVAQLSQEALNAFDAMRGISTVDLSIDTSSLDATSRSLAKVSEQLARIKAESGVGMSGFGRWAMDTQRASLEIQAAYLEQKRSLQSLMDDYERGTMKLGDFVSAAKGARNGLSLLNDSDMRQLESAIEAANQKIQQLKEGSKSTLVSLREELAGLRGEQEAVDRSRFNSRKAELQQQLAEAQGSGDMNAVQNLMTALATLQQIQAETDAKRQREEQQKRVDEQNAAKAAAAPPASPPASSPPPRVVRFETARGAVDVAVASEQDETNLLGVLEQASMRTGR